MPVLYLAPWVDYGGSDSGTIDWFRWIDRERFAPSLITTQPSLNRRIHEVVPYAEEVWALPDLFDAAAFPAFIRDFIETRGIRLVHLMNSRLGFNMLADIRSLAEPPATVVQLHVEEPDRSGYVRYVSTRYGNLVDAFCLTSEHLADTVVNEYDIPRDRCRVIHTGVDARGRFAPGDTRPITGLDHGLVHVVWPSRITPQKDPMLMLEVAAGLQERGLPFQVHVVGDGNLEPELGAAVAERRLGDRVRLHGASSEMPAWYAAADIMLMTSVFEGVPYAVYEAMAMELPTVAPALAGNIEALGNDAGLLVWPRDDVAGYVDALSELITNPSRRREMGAAGRRRALQQFSMEDMASRYGELYQSLLADGSPSMLRVKVPIPDPVLCDDRAPYRQELVSVIIPCYNHGRWLAECLASLRAQTYPNIEILVVDDGSSETETVALLERLGLDPDITLIRLERNSGPSRARNVALDRARGRYILPLDADNRLEPEAVERLVGQLATAGERVAYVYPNQLYVGNRDDYSEAPEFNLHNLSRQNYCDTCSLFDRSVFDEGVRFAEDIGLGHEDWDLALQLAERQLVGEPARGRTLITRKAGFTRSDLVEHAFDDHLQTMRRRHPSIYANEAGLKARWSPALSIVALGAVPQRSRQMKLLRNRIEGQTCADAELILRLTEPWHDDGVGPAVRRMPPALARSEAEALAAGTVKARGRYILVTRGSGTELLEDRALVEKVLRVFEENGGSGAIVFADAGPTRISCARIDPADKAQLQPFAVAWPALAFVDGQVAVEGDAALESVLARVADELPTHWRHVQAPDKPPADRAAPAHHGLRVRLGGAPAWRPSAGTERHWRLDQQPLLPCRVNVEHSMRDPQPWAPPNTMPLCRHRSLDGQHRVFTNSRQSPPGYALEYELGASSKHHLAGTVQLIAAASGFRTDADLPLQPGEQSMGFVETSSILPLLDQVHVATHKNGQTVLVSGWDDPLLPMVELVQLLGFIEPSPIRPRPHPFANNSLRVMNALNRRDTELIELEGLRSRAAIQESQIDALWSRVNGIHASIPGRIYHFLAWLPGLKRLLLVRPPKPKDEPESLP